MASKTLDIVLRALGQDQVKSAIEGVGDAAKKTGEDVSKAGADSAKSFDGASASAVSLTEKLEGVRNTAIKVGAGGAALLALGNHLADAALKADGLGSTMAALLSGSGMEGATEKVKALSDEIARVAGGDNNAIAVEISRAIATGRTKGLAAYGIVIGEVGQQAIKAAGQISEAAGKQETSNQIMLAGAEAVAKLRENSSDAALSLSEMDFRMKKLSEGVGQGAANAKAAILGGILSPVMSVLEASPGLQTFAGGFIEIGGAGVTAGASMVAFASQALISAEKLGILGFAKAADVAASGRVATASGISAAAITAEGNAALVASGKYAALGRAKALAMGIGKVAGVVGAGILAGSAIYDATRGDKPSASQIGGYYWNRLRGDNPNDAATRALGVDPNEKGDNAEKESLRLSQASAARRAAAMATTAAPAISPLTSMLPSGADIGAAPGLVTNARPQTPAPTATNGANDMAARVLAAMMSGGQIGGGLRLDPGAVKGGSARGGGGKDITVQAKGKTTQDGAGNIHVKFDEIVLPYTGLASVGSVGGF